jgi:hypothetical protein
MPFSGVNAFLGDASANIGPGLRVGTLLGGRLGQYASLDGEAIVDVLRPLAPGASNVRGQLSFNPLAHVSAGAVELLGGPKLGFAVGQAHSSPDLVTRTMITTNYLGWLAGLDGGVLVRVSRAVSIGGLLAFELHGISAGSCTITSGDPCQFHPGGAVSKMLSLSAAALF